MKTLTLSAMFAAVITFAMAAPTEAQAKPMKWGHNYSPKKGTFQKSKRSERRIRNKIVKLSKKKHALQVRNNRLAT